MNQQSEARQTVGIVNSPGNKKLIEQLKAQGREVLLFPAIEPRENDPGTSALNWPAHILNYDWIVFSDIFTVEVFLEQLEKQGVDLFELDELRICSLGEAVADRLRFRQIHSDVIPPANSSGAAFTAIKDYIYDENEPNGMRFLILKSGEEESELGTMLSRQQALVTEVDIYRNASRNHPDISRLKALILGGAVDEFVFGAPEDVIGLFEIVGKDEFARALAELNIVASSEITRQTLAEFNVPSEKEKRG